MELIKLTESEFKILEVMVKYKTYKRANADLYKLKLKGKLWFYIFELEKKGVFKLTRKLNKYVEEIKVIEDSFQYIDKVNFIEEIEDDDYDKEQTVVDDKDTIRFQLQKLKSDSIFSSQFGGVISFPNQIILEANKKYIYAVFKRENDDMLFTLTPEDKIIQSAQHFDLEDHPTHIRKIIRDFLNAIKNKKKGL